MFSWAFASPQASMPGMTDCGKSSDGVSALAHPPVRSRVCVEFRTAVHKFRSFGDYECELRDSGTQRALSRADPWAAPQGGAAPFLTKKLVAAQKPRPSVAGAYFLPAPAAHNHQPFTDPSNVAVGTTVDPSPPAQIRTCRLPAYGSYLE